MVNNTAMAVLAKYECLNQIWKWVSGHGSKGSPFLDGSRGSWVIASDPSTNDDEITAQ